MSTATLEARELQALHSRVSGWNGKTLPFRAALAEVDKVSERNKDVDMRLSDLRLTEHLTAQGMPFTKNAMKQLLGVVGADAGILGLFTMRRSDLLAIAVNDALDNEADKRVEVRMRQGEDGQKTIRAVLSRERKQADAVQVMELIADTYKERLDNAVVSRLDANGDAFRFNIFFADDKIKGKDSDYGRGMQVVVNETTISSPQITAYTFDYACCNGMVHKAQSVKMPLVFAEKFIVPVSSRRALEQSAEGLFQFGGDLLKQMGYLYEVPVPEPFQLLGFLIHRLRLPREGGEQAVNGYLDEICRLGRPKASAIAVVNAFNNGAQRVKSDALRESMEEAAASLLTRGASFDTVKTRWDRLIDEAKSFTAPDYQKYMWEARAANN